MEERSLLDFSKTDKHYRILRAMKEFLEEEKEIIGNEEPSSQMYTLMRDKAIAEVGV